LNQLFKKGELCVIRHCEKPTATKQSRTLDLPLRGTKAWEYYNGHVALRLALTCRYPRGKLHEGSRLMQKSLKKGKQEIPPHLNPLLQWKRGGKPFLKRSWRLQRPKIINHERFLHVKPLLQKNSQNLPLLRGLEIGVFFSQEIDAVQRFQAFSFHFQ